MKKTLTLIITTVFLLLNMASCGLPSTINYEGKYWYADATASSNIYEQITYDVKVVSRTESNSNEVKNEFVSLVLDSGSFVTTLSKDGDNYLYETSLNVSGNYVYGNEKHPLNDDLQSKAVFSVNGFNPVYSEKKSNSTTTLALLNNAYTLINYSYDYKVEYKGNNAQTTYTSKIANDPAKTITNTYKNYTDNAYIDNELVTFMPRAINFNNKETYSLAFTTIDVLTQKLHDMTYTTATNNSKIDVKNFTFTYDNVINDEKVTYTENKIQVIKVLLMINDTFSGSTIELYYAMDHQTHRHRLIKAYTPLNDQMGYMEYTIKSAVLNTNI